MNLPLVTLRINSYNHSKYLEEAVLAAVNQTYQNIEIIAIDDGSSDESTQILKKLSEEHGFYFRSQKNKGLSATINDIIENIAKGKYLIGTASDDVLEPTTVERYVEFMEANPSYGMCYGNAYKIDEKSNRIGEIKGSGDSGDLFEKIALGNVSLPMMTFMWRLDIFEKIGVYDETLATEDIYMLYKVSKNYPIGYVDTFAKSYRIHRENSTTNHWKMYENAVRVADLYKEEPFYNEMMKLRHLQWFYLLSRKYKKESLKYLFAAIKHPLNKLFYGGVLHLIGLSFLIDKARYK